MKKFSFLLAMMLVLAFASNAFAAQVIVGATDASNPAVYKATVKDFTYDGKSNYPYEIYLPNENPQNYRIHSNYTKNTDACAACHATHTAVGNSLLQWYTVYDTCMACHDGTVTTTYDVQAGVIGLSSKATYGGHFGTGAEASLSNHNVTGAMEIAAAPGGAVIDTEEVAGAHGATEKRWATEFGCESCHTPHGQGGNARILHPDANYAASWAAKNKTEGAYKYYVSDVSGYVYADAAFATEPVYIIKGYPYSPAVKVDGASNYAATIDNTSGVSKVVYATANPTATVTIESGVAALQVKMAITDYLKETETVEHKAGMNYFCGACHTDYNTAAFTDSGSAEMETGVYSKAHRHQVGFDAPYFNISGANMVKEDGKMECLTCHVAHGASGDYWQRTVGSLATTEGRLTAAYLDDADLAEISGSSALKRLPNMGTCEACHGKGGGNEGYNVNTDQVGYANTAATAVDSLMPNTYNTTAIASDYDPADLGWVGNAKCEGCHKEYVEGWRATKHATSSHTGGCGSCHNPGNTIMGNTGTFATALAGDGTKDAGITCESCHGTGARHVAAPSSNNIFNPGKTSVERQAIECGKCHDMYNNTVADDFGNLSATSGMRAVAKTTAVKLAEIEDLNNWSVAFRVYDNDPAKFAIASQKTAVSSHYGGAWGYADSKHFLGTGTAENPNGIVSCNTCHNQHSDANAGLLKQSYNQVCSACHDMTANLVQAVAMPTNAWGRHQLELRDYAHSFKFGAPATIAAADIDFVNLEQATLGLTPVVTSLTDVFDGTDQTTKNNSLWRTSSSGGGVGPRITVYSDAGKTTQVFNNYDGTWELLASPGTAVEGVDFHFEPTGAIEFENNVDTYNTGKLAGTYTVKWTSKANPTLTVTKSFTVTH